MPRPIRTRRIFFQPKVNYFKPIGIPLRNLKESILTFEELEAIRLIDSENLDQNQAGKKMGISQSTLSRLLCSARKKLVNAIIKGNSIKIQGGNFKMVVPRRGMGLGQRNTAGGRGRMGGIAKGPEGICKCPKCGYEEAQERGIPCMSKKCPKCSTKMIRR